MRENKECGSNLGHKILNVILLSLCIILALIVTIFATGFVAAKTMDMGVYQIEGESMKPTIDDNAYVITRGDMDIKRFDMVIIKSQNDTLLKRVIGMPQDIISVIDGSLFVNGQLYEESYLIDEQCQKFKSATFQVVVPNDSYFVLGDNRDNSSDSRTLGMIKKQEIRGVAVAHMKG